MKKWGSRFFAMKCGSSCNGYIMARSHTRRAHKTPPDAVFFDWYDARPPASIRAYMATSGVVPANIESAICQRYFPPRKIEYDPLCLSKDGRVQHILPD